MNKVLTILFLGIFLSCSNYGKLTFITKLPVKLKENSGIVALDSSSVWIVSDKGNSNTIYEVNFKGQLLSEINLGNTTNMDWEDLARDGEGNLYIGDFGNNLNNRKDLVVYKIPNPKNFSGKPIEAGKIYFSYPDQPGFPPPISNRRYDAEGFFFSGDMLYIITKNRSRPFTGKTFVYSIPAVPGEYVATLVGSFRTCEQPYRCMVTSADISPDGKTIVVLGQGLLWVFTDFTGPDFTRGIMTTIDLGARTQLESICFLDETTLLLSDEESGNTGRNLYSYALNR